MTLKLGFLVESKDQLHLLFQFYESVYLATLNAEVLYWNTLKSLLFIFNSLTLTVNLLDDTDHIELKKTKEIVLVVTTFGVFLITCIICYLVINHKKGNNR